MSPASIVLERILCPTDFSELSAEALLHARKFAECYEAELHILHVVDEAYQHWMAIGPEGMPVGPSADDLLDAGRSQMDAFLQAHATALRCTVIHEVVFGRPFMEIINYAGKHQADLIVIATHGRGGLTRALLGSTTDKVVHKAPCPVLVVRQKQHETPDKEDQT